jgi:hypothetical protein
MREPVWQEICYCYRYGKQAVKETEVIKPGLRNWMMLAFGGLVIPVLVLLSWPV